MKSFLKQKKTIRKLSIMAGLIAAVFLHILVFNCFSENGFNFVDAYNSTINVSLKVIENPVERADDLEESEKFLEKNLSLENPRIVAAFPEKEIASRESRVLGSTIILKGRSIYPSSQVILEIFSDSFIVSTMSDSSGAWQWTNLGWPLESGKHTVEIANFSPFILSGSRDIFIQKYSFFVDSAADVLLPESFNVEEASPEESWQADDLRTKISAGSIRNLFAFDVLVPGKEVFSPGEEMSIQFIFTPFGKIENQKGKINYEIFKLEKSTGKFESVSRFEDDIALSFANPAFLKKIKLREKLEGGDYFLKVGARIGDDEYAQNAHFSITPRTLIQMGNLRINEVKFVKTVYWNILFILAFIFVIILVISWELWRFRKNRALDENFLRTKKMIRN